MKYIIGIIFFILCNRFVYGEDTLGNLYPIYDKKSKKCGYIDKMGNLKIPYKFYFCREFKENAKYAVIYSKSFDNANLTDKQGNFIFPEDMDFIDPYYNGYALFGKNKKKGILNSDAKIVIPPEFESLSEAHRGNNENIQFIFKKNKEGSDRIITGIIDETNKILISFDSGQKQVISVFSNGLAIICDFLGQDCNVIDKKGNKFINKSFFKVKIESNSQFIKDDILIVYSEKEVATINPVIKDKDIYVGADDIIRHNLCGFIDTSSKKGNWILPPKYVGCEVFHNYLFASEIYTVQMLSVDVNLLKTSIYDKKGNHIRILEEDIYDPSTMIHPIKRNRYYSVSVGWGNFFEKCEKYPDNLIPYVSNYMGDNKYGYMTCNLEPIIRPKFTIAHEFSNGLAYVRIDDYQKGFIDINGKFKINILSSIPLEAISSPFDKDGIVILYLKSNWITKWYMNTTGKIIGKNELESH